MERLNIPIDIKLVFVDDKALPNTYFRADETIAEATLAFKNDLYAAVDRSIRTSLPQVKLVSLVGVPRTGSWELIAGELQLWVKTGFEFLGIYFTLKNFEPIYSPMVAAVLSVCGDDLRSGEFTFSVPRASTKVRVKLTGGSRTYRFGRNELLDRRVFEPLFRAQRRRIVLERLLLTILPLTAAAGVMWFLNTDFRSPDTASGTKTTEKPTDPEGNNSAYNIIEINISHSSSGAPTTEQIEASSNEEAEAEDEDLTIRIFKNGRELP